LRIRSPDRATYARRQDRLALPRLGREQTATLGESAHWVLTAFLGRAMGWYVMALVDILDDMPRNHPRRDEIIAILNRTSVALARVQDAATGVWNQVLDQGTRAGNYLESSASCMFVYAMLKGARNNYLPSEFRTIAQRAYDGIIEQFVEVDQDGQVHLTSTCQSAGLGGTPYRDGSYEYYIHEPIVMDNHHGVGAFILASVESESRSTNRDN